MRKLWFTVICICWTLVVYGQKSLISYEDIKYILHNNINQTDTFLLAKGYVITKQDNKNKTRKYALTLKDNTHNEISVRADGKRLFIEIETNEIAQYDLVRESIAQYINKDEVSSGVQSYTVKDLGNMYITINDTVPYNVMRKDYDIQIVSDKHITAYN